MNTTTAPTRRPRVALVPTARPTFVVDIAEQRAREARDLLVELGAEVVGPEKLVMTPADAQAAAVHLEGDVDLVVHACASFSDASPALELYEGRDEPVLLWSFREPGPVGDRLWLNSMCGANLMGHALVRAGVGVRHVHGDPSETAVRAALEAALAGELPVAPELPTAQAERGETDRAREALEELRGRTIGVIGDPPPGFTPSQFDAKVLEDVFGLRVHAIELDEAFERIEAVGAAERDDEVAAATAAQPSLAGLDPDQVRTHAAVTTALRGWTAAEVLDAVALRCWPEIPTRLGACPCSSLSRLADAGTPTVCERDVHGAVTMLLLEALGAGTTYLVDTVDLVEENDIVRLWHCGSAATSLAAEPTEATQGVHCNRKIGVAGDFPLKTGPVVMARLTEGLPGAEHPFRLLVAAGESVPAPNRFQGNTADVRLGTSAADFVAGLVSGGFPHHTVLAWTDVRPALRAAADLIGIPVTEY